ncbi:MAG: translation initiation factor IF-2 [Candidatus Paceibacterota bacterium]
MKNIRPPIVVVMGHVDHGKTTLLDYIRKSNKAKGEAGGITQSVGAYEIEHDSKKITFIDTPGHEAFSRMRSHGAKIADLAILVVAADDGVKPQTENSLKYIKDAKIPFVVAINKTDLPNVNTEKTKQELSKAEVFLEGMGGDVSYQEISALNGDGVSDLLDLVNLLAEVEELTYDSENPAKGVILTSLRDSQKGIMVGGIIKDGVLKKGDEIFTASAEGKVKMIENSDGEKSDSFSPSSPVLIFGFNSLPSIGEEFSVGSKPEAIKKEEIEDIKLEDFKETMNLLLKADESGSLEALEDLVRKVSKDLPLKIVDSSTGNIHENDMKKAFSMNAFVVGFNCKIDKSSENLAKTQNIKIITSSIIYDLEEKIREYAEKEALREERIIDVLGTFGKSGDNQVIGGKVIKGKVLNQENFSVFSNDKEIGKGKIINLQSQKKDMQEVEEENEVGILVSCDTNIKVGNKLVFTDKI